LLLGRQSSDFRKSAVYASRQYMAPKLRSFIDFVCAQLGGPSFFVP
jgi:hypothetical protein